MSSPLPSLASIWDPGGDFDVVLPFRMHSLLSLLSIGLGAHCPCLCREEGEKGKGVSFTGRFAILKAPISPLR